MCIVQEGTIICHYEQQDIVTNSYVREFTLPVMQGPHYHSCEILWLNKHSTSSKFTFAHTKYLCDLIHSDTELLEAITNQCFMNGMVLAISHLTSVCSAKLSHTTRAGHFCIAILLRRYFVQKVSVHFGTFCESICTKYRILEHHPHVFCKLLQYHCIRYWIVCNA